MTIDESARRLGGLVWTERRLFEVLGRWVPTTPAPAAKIELSRASRRHGEHTLALAVLLPDTRDHDPEALVRPSGDPAPIERLAGAETTAERLGGLLEPVSAGHLRALEEYLAAAVPVRDAPGMRVVAVVLAEDRAGFERLARAVVR